MRMGCQRIRCIEGVIWRCAKCEGGCIGFVFMEKLVSLRVLTLYFM